VTAGGWTRIGFLPLKIMDGSSMLGYAPSSSIAVSSAPTIGGGRIRKAVNLILVCVPPVLGAGKGDAAAADPGNDTGGDGIFEETDRL